MLRRPRNTVLFYNEGYASSCVQEVKHVKDVVKFSFVVQKSVAYLDLNIGEFSNFRKNLSANISEETLKENKALITEESCKKYWAPNRKWLYDLNLDVTKELEVSLRNIGDQEKRFCYSKEILLNKIVLISRLYKTCLLNFIKAKLLSDEEKVNFIGKLSKVAKRFDFIANDNYIGKLGLIALWKEEGDSIKAYNFLTAMNFPDGHLFMLPLEVFEYVLRHADQTGLNVWPNLANLDPINTTMCSSYYLRTICLFQYFDAPRFCGDLHTDRTHWRYLLPEDALNILVENNLITRARYFLIMQIVHVFLNQTPEALQALEMVWRSIPDPFITRQEFRFAMPGMPDAEFEDFTDFVKERTGEEVVEGLQIRKLQHHCRTIIRRALANNQQLARGIDQLKLPDHPRLPPAIESYLRLEK